MKNPNGRNDIQESPFIVALKQNESTKMSAFCAKDEIISYLHKWCWQLVIKSNGTVKARLPDRKHRI